MESDDESGSAGPTVAELEAERAALEAEILRAKAAQERAAQRQQTKRGPTVLAAPSPSPKKRRVVVPQPDCYDSTLAGPPPMFDFSVQGESSRKETSRSKYQDIPFEPYGSAPRPSKLLAGIEAVTVNFKNVEKMKKAHETKSTGFNSIPERAAPPKSKELALSKSAPASRVTRESDRSREDLGIGTSKLKAIGSERDKKPGVIESRSKSRKEKEVDDEDSDGLHIVGAPKHNKRRKDFTVIEELVAGPIDHRPIRGDPLFDTLEPNSGIRLRPNSRLISHAQLQLHLSDRYHLTPAQVYSIGRHTATSAVELDVELDVIIIGVLAWKSELRYTNSQAGIKEETAAEAERKKKSKVWDNVKGVKPEEDEEEPPEDDEDEDVKPRDVFKPATAKQKARRYLRFTLVDLSTESAAASGTGSLNVTLFESDRQDETVDENGFKKIRYSGGSGGAYEKFWKEEPGAVVALLNPRVSRPPPDTPSGIFSLTPASDEGMLVIGQSRDLRSCQARTREGKVCNSWVDGRVGEVCKFHTELQVKRTGARRPETYSANSSLTSTVSFDSKKFSAGFKPGGRPSVKAAWSRGGAPYDPINKIGLLPRDNVSMIDGAKTYVVAAPRAQTGRGARIRAVPGVSGGGGYIPGVRDGPSVQQTKRDAKDLQMKKELRREERKNLLEKDKGSIGSVYLRAVPVKTEEEEDDEEEEGEEKEEKRRSRPFNTLAVRRLGFDPTRTAANAMEDDDDDEVKSKKLASISALIAFTEQRGAPNLSVLPGPRVRSSVRAPIEEKKATSKDDDCENDLPDLRQSHQTKSLLGRAHSKPIVTEEEDDDDDGLIVLPKEGNTA